MDDLSVHKRMKRTRAWKIFAKEGFSDMSIASWFVTWHPELWDSPLEVMKYDPEYVAHIAQRDAHRLSQ